MRSAGIQEHTASVAVSQYPCSIPYALTLQSAKTPRLELCYQPAKAQRRPGVPYTLERRDGSRWLDVARHGSTWLGLALYCSSHCSVMLFTRSIRNSLHFVASVQPSDE